MYSVRIKTGVPGFERAGAELFKLVPLSSDVPAADIAPSLQIHSSSASSDADVPLAFVCSCQ
jgi:hypothetical protein